MSKPKDLDMTEVPLHLLGYQEWGAVISLLCFKGDGTLYVHEDEMIHMADSCGGKELKAGLLPNKTLVFYLEDIEDASSDQPVDE